MVKKRVGGAHRFSKALSKHGGSGTGVQQQQQQRADKAHEQKEAATGPKPPSHLQRKITKSVKFYEKVLTATATAPKAPQVREGGKSSACVFFCVFLCLCCVWVFHSRHTYNGGVQIAVLSCTCTRVLGCWGRSR